MQTIRQFPEYTVSFEFVVQPRETIPGLVVDCTVLRIGIRDRQFDVIGNPGNNVSAIDIETGEIVKIQLIPWV